jgi:hypothetical protein
MGTPWEALDRVARYYTLRVKSLNKQVPHRRTALRKKSQCPLAIARDNLWTAFSVMIREWYKGFTSNQSGGRKPRRKRNGERQLGRLESV